MLVVGWELGRFGCVIRWFWCCDEEENEEYTLLRNEAGWSVTESLWAMIVFFEGVMY